MALDDRKAFATFRTCLFCSQSALTPKSNWEDAKSSNDKLANIKTYPEIDGSPNTLQTTDLEDQSHTYIMGVQGGSNSTLDFTSNFTLASYKNVRDNIPPTFNDYYYMLQFFSDGTGVHPGENLGAWLWTGTHSVSVNAGSVDAVREMTIHCVPSSAIKFSESASSSNSGNG